MNAIALGDISCNFAAGSCRMIPFIIQSLVSNFSLVSTFFSDASWLTRLASVKAKQP